MCHPECNEGSKILHFVQNDKNQGHPERPSACPVRNFFLYPSTFILSNRGHPERSAIVLQDLWREGSLYSSAHHSHKFFLIIGSPRRGTALPSIKFQ